jgi:hypothetical protein
MLSQRSRLFRPEVQTRNTRLPAPIILFWNDILGEAIHELPSSMRTYFASEPQAPSSIEQLPMKSRSSMHMRLSGIDHLRDNLGCPDRTLTLVRAGGVSGKRQAAGTHS